jgi:ATP-dependent RNA helicase RhlE
VAKEALRNPKRLDLAPPSRPASGIEQTIYPVPRHLKPALLEEILIRSPEHSVLVFTRTKHGADRLTRQLRNRGREVAVIHGDRSQGQRERALSDFKRGRVGVLVATDIASRGIDVDDITHVINYDVPRTPEDYVHRIGRTGRMDATGDAFTLASPEEHEDVAAIERFLGIRVPRVTLEGFDYKRRSVVEPSDRGGHSHASRTHGTGRSSGPHRGGSSSVHIPAARVVSGVADAADHGRRKKINAGDRRSRRKM